MSATELNKNTQIPLWDGYPEPNMLALPPHGYDASLADFRLLLLRELVLTIGISRDIVDALHSTNTWASLAATMECTDHAVPTGNMREILEQNRADTLARHLKANPSDRAVWEALLAVEHYAPGRAPAHLTSAVHEANITRREDKSLRELRGSAVDAASGVFVMVLLEITERLFHPTRAPRTGRVASLWPRAGMLSPWYITLRHPSAAFRTAFKGISTPAVWAMTGVALTPLGIDRQGCVTAEGLRAAGIAKPCAAGLKVNLYTLTRRQRAKLLTRATTLSVKGGKCLKWPREPVSKVGAKNDDE